MLDTSSIGPFKISHSGPEDDDINVSFKNLNVNVAGAQMHIEDVADAGWIMMPPR